MTWERVKLSEVALINPRAPQLSDDESVSFVPMAAISEHTQRIEVEEIRTYAEVRKGYTGFSHGDVLLAKITPCFENGKMAIADISNKHGFGSTEFHVMRTNSSRLDTRYLYHYLRQEKILVEGEKKMTGSGGQRRVPRTFLDSLEIPLPPLSTQQRIAAVLDEVDALRQKRERGIKSLKEFQVSKFVDMFGDASINSKGFDLVKAGSLLHGKPQIGSIVPVSTDGAIKIVRVGEIGNDRIKIKKCMSTSVSDAERLKYKLLDGDLLFARAIGSESHLGKASIYRDEDGEMIFDSHVMRVRFKEELVNPIYFLVWLKTRGGRASFMRRAGRTAVQFNINSQQFSDIDINLPPITIQNAYASIYFQIENEQNNFLASLKELENLHSALLKIAFSGELNLR